MAAVGVPVLVRVAAWRTQKQPMSCHPEAEVLLLRTLLKRPQDSALVLDLEAEHFVDPARGSLWSEMKSHCMKYVEHGEETTREQSLGNRDTLNGKLPENFKEMLTFNVLNAAAVEGDADIMNEADMVVAAEKIYSSGLDRTRYVGNSKVVRTGDPLAPLMRDASRPTKAHILVYLLVMFTGTLVSLSVGTAVSSGVAAVAYAASMLVLLSGGIVWTIVDLDTLYIDVPTLLLFGGSAWALTAIGAFISGTLANVLTALAATLVVVGSVFIMSLGHAKLRGNPGMGTGDFMLMPATLGVPVAITGMWVMTNWILLTSLILGILGWVVKYLKVQDFGRRTPYAFGPYLACGWVLTLGLWRITL